MSGDNININSGGGNMSIVGSAIGKGNNISNNTGDTQSKNYSPNQSESENDRELCYETSAIREMISAGLSDSELMTFCYDYFQVVSDVFSDGMGKLQKIQLLIDHCARNGTIPTLIDKFKAYNPHQYEKFRAKIER